MLFKKNFRFDLKEIKNKFSKYFEDGWNYIDLVGCSLFFIGIILRFISVSMDENIFSYAKYFCEKYY